ETDVLADEVPVDGVVLVPAYIEAGRLTADSVHWMRTAEGMLPVGQSEFARDATFGYANSRLPEWIEEKTGGRVAAADVLRITLEDLRVRGPEHVAGLLGSLREGRTAVADALTDDDLRVLALASATAEATGARLLYRCGPSFVRARAGQGARAPLTAQELRAGRGQGYGHGLIAVGSHVG
ncbi:four-carbon acid sugar kinase family protein, partial [Streptomyces sp. MCAF7]